MLITRDVESEEMVYNFLNEGYKKIARGRSGEIHVSDLQMPLRAYYDKMFPDNDYTHDAIGYFLIGLSFEHFVAGMINEADPMFGTKASDEWNGIKYEADAFRNTLDTPTAGLILPWEFKTNRATHRYGDKDTGLQPEMIDNLGPQELAAFFEHNLNQLRRYQVITKSNAGKLLILFTGMTVEYTSNIAFGKRKPRIRVYNAYYDDEELEETSREMIETRDLLNEAILTKNPSKIPACPRFFCEYCQHFTNKVCPGADVVNMNQVMEGDITMLRT
jgi:hypothetical protein